MSARLGLVAVTAAAMLAVLTPAASAKVPVKFKTMAGYPSPGTPQNLNVVGVLKTGDPKAKNVLVLNPGTSASAAYFEPLAKSIVKMLPGWQVWAVERRENYLEDQSELNLLKQGKVSPTDFFNYYLGYLSNSSITNHVHNVPDSAVPFARQWGMNTEINDLRVVVKAAAKKRPQRGDGRSFARRIDRDRLCDLGLQRPTGRARPVRTRVDRRRQQSDARDGRPGTDLAEQPADLNPLARVRRHSGAPCGPIRDGRLRSHEGVAQHPLGLSGLAVAAVQPAASAWVNPTNEAGYGLSTDVKTSPSSLLAAQVHSGQLAASGDPRGWDRAGNITPIQRWASMFSGWGLQNLDGTAWYHPLRLSIDSGAVGDGLPNPAQSVLDVHSTDASKLRKRMKIYAFAAALGGTRVISAAQSLAAEAGIPRKNLKLVDRSATYAHNDPSAAEPKRNAFLKKLIPFLNSISGGKQGAKKESGSPPVPL